MLLSCGPLFASLLAFLASPGGPIPGVVGGCPVDGSRYVILPPGDLVTWREGLHISEYPLTRADIEQAECMLIERVEVVNAGLALEGGGEHIEPGDYFRQYCVVRDKDGHRILFLNAFCSLPDPKGSWQRAWVEVDNGGACYFQVLFDLTTGQVVEFSVNGEA